jgi:hypothetical protein
MWPGFQDGDLLEVESVSIARLRRGDIIVYRHHDGLQIVHRVVITGHALRTRGDAGIKYDDFLVDEEQLVGRVIRRHRLGDESPVPGGWRGRILAKGYHLASRLNPMRPSRGGRLARRFSGMTMWVFGGFWRRGEIREVHLAGQSPVTIKYWGKRAIGRKDLSSGEWLLYWPWCVVLRVAQTEFHPSCTPESKSGRCQTKHQH